MTWKETLGSEAEFKPAIYNFRKPLYWEKPDKNFRIEFAMLNWNPILMGHASALHPSWIHPSLDQTSKVQRFSICDIISPTMFRRAGSRWELIKIHNERPNPATNDDDDDDAVVRVQYATSNYPTPKNRRNVQLSSRGVAGWLHTGTQQR